MKKQKSLNNKGFSLVELIIVIAIMAILTGVLAPNFIRYLARANESADIQLLDNIRSVFATTLMDPQLFEEGSRNAALGQKITLTPTPTGSTTIWQSNGSTSPFARVIAEQLSYETYTAMIADDGLRSEIRSNDGEGNSVITVVISNTGAVTSVTMDNSTGGDADDGENGILTVD